MQVLRYYVTADVLLANIPTISLHGPTIPRMLAAILVLHRNWRFASGLQLQRPTFFPASALQHLHLLFAKKNLVTSGQLIAAEYCIMAYGSENNRPPLHRSNPKPEALNRISSQIKALVLRIIIG